MKYNIEKNEEKWRKFWQKNKIYRFNSQSKKPIFSIDTPPPYVSASHLHAGHIMSYAQAEFVARYKRMAGFNVYYPMGFDDNGLPTERFVEKKYNINKSKITRPEFIKLCLKQTKLGAKNYKKLWNVLGISVDWSKTYSTINKHCRLLAQWSFIDLYNKKLIYRDQRPIMWCTTCETAIAQADLEDKEKQTNLVYIKAKTSQGKEVVFATTRPELLPSCVGISVHPQDKRYKKLIGQKVILPLTKAKIELTTDKIVDPKFGTGMVYFCSSGDRQFLQWETKHPVKNKIYLLNPDGTMNKSAGDYQGLTVKQTRKKIISDLKKAGALVKLEKLKHTVNTHERCGTDVEYIDSKQWFIKLLKYKQKLLEQGNKLTWHPKFMKRRFIDWVKNLQWDWCISRQRYYGVPFPLWYCKKCHYVILPEIKDLPVDPSLDKPPVDKCPKCKNNEIIGEKDVMDTWMTSSLTPLIGASLSDKSIVKNLKKAYKSKLYPANLRPQAFEIIRTWLFYTIVKSYFHHKCLPFKHVMISGHGLDEKGRKISKRLGNYELPEKIIKKYGADAIRYWATGARLGKNMRYQESEVKKGKKTVLKIWNASQFALHHLKNFKPDKNFKPTNEIDIWLLHKLQLTIQKTTKNFDKYQYFKTRETIDKFFWSILCDNYLEFIKHRLYNKKDAGAKNTLFIALKTILKLYAPILPFITEQVWQSLSKTIKTDFEKSIHISSWPQINQKYLSPKKAQKIKPFLQAVNNVRSYKSAQKIPLGKELEKYKLKINKLNSRQKQELKAIMRIKKLI